MKNSSKVSQKIGGQKMAIKKKVMYFTDVHEKAIQDFKSETDKKKKDEIFTKILQPVFMEMIEKIVFSFRFDRVLENIDEHIGDCLSYLIIIVHNYDNSRMMKENSEKKSKAFSYFSVIIRNYFFNVVKKNVTKTKEKVADFDEQKMFENIPDITNIEDEIEKYQFKKALLENVVRWTNNKHSTEDDVKVLKAIKILIETIGEYDCFNKKAFFIFIKDLTGLNSKQISSSLKKIKIRYGIFLDNWNYGIK